MPLRQLGSILEETFKVFSTSCGGASNCGAFLAAMGADEAQIEASFCEPIRIAREQKSVSLEKRAEATYAEYRRQKASSLGARGLRLPLC